MSLRSGRADKANTTGFYTQNEHEVKRSKPRGGGILAFFGCGVPRERSEWAEAPGGRRHGSTASMTGPAGQKGGTTADMLAGQRRSASVSGAIPMNEERLPKMDGRTSLPGTQVGPLLLHLRVHPAPAQPHYFPSHISTKQQYVVCVAWLRVLRPAWYLGHRVPLPFHALTHALAYHIPAAPWPRRPWPQAPLPPPPLAAIHPLYPGRSSGPQQSTQA